MAKQSENINLTLPEVTDKITDSIPAIAENFDRIDKSIGEYNTHKNNTEIHHTHANKAILDEITTDKVEKWDSKSEVVFGTYTGDGSTSRFINLGFTPVAVEVYTDTGKQAGATGGLNNNYYGGLALNGYPCRDVIEVVENGFNVFYDSKNSSLSNNQGTVYYFKAYKNGTIQEV